MRIVKGMALCITILVVCSNLCSAQSISGFPPFGSFTNVGTETINLGNLNAHWEFPVANRSGRIPFSFAISYDSTVWSIQNFAFQPTFGLEPSTSAIFGQITYNQVFRTCTFNHEQYGWQHYTITGYSDKQATVHPVNFDISDASLWSLPCSPNDSSPTSGAATATDSSGYLVSVSFDSNRQLHGKVTSRDGDNIVPPNWDGDAYFGPISWTDRNGNQLNANVSYVNGHQITTLTDTLGTVVLTDDRNLNAPQHTYTYPKPGGGTATVSFAYGSYTVQSNFGCPNFAEFGPTTMTLVSSIQMPDGAYAFTYEPTPGYSGSVTGRPASITLPSGGAVSYQYTGPNNGANCNDGTIMGYNRQTQDGTVSYSRSGNVTTVSDQLGHSAQYSFTPTYYETSRTYFNSGTTIAIINTSYNGGGLSHITKTTTLPNNLQSDTDAFFDSNGLPTEVDDYDWGIGAPGVLMRQTTTTYQALGNNILDQPYRITVKDRSGTQVAQTTWIR